MEKKEESNNVVNGHDEKQEEGKGDDPFPLLALNHVSRLCRDVKASIDFYKDVLGLVMIERPEAFDFDGAWLFNYGVGVHLVQSKDDRRLPDPDINLDPKDNHISFQCEDMEAMEEGLKKHGVKYMKRAIGDENGTKIDQLFFTDPDGFMIEICNCENLTLVPAGPLGENIKLLLDRHNPPLELDNNNGHAPHHQHEKQEGYMMI